MNATLPSAKGMESIRNIGVLAHVDAGKTSITEKMLFLAGLRRETGTVDEGTTATDYLSVERLHGITVKSAAVRFEWAGVGVHLIDTPGHVDFGGEVDRALRILDGAVIALCAVSGVQARTEVIAKAVASRKLPRIYFINKMDRAGADFPGVIQDLRAILEPDAVAIQYPLFEDRKWLGIVDLVTMEPHYLAEEGISGGADCSEPLTLLSPAALSPSSKAAALAARALLLEKVAERDEEILALYASNQEVPSELLARAAANAVKACGLVPVLCGSAFVDCSVSILLDSVIAMLPSPAEASVPPGIDPCTRMPLTILPEGKSHLSAFVFKTLRDSAGDNYAWTRIWSGSLSAGRKTFDARSSRDVIIKKIFGIHAETLTELREAGAGEVVALKTAGLEPGASLCERAFPVLFESLEVPDPVVSQIMEPNSAQDAAALRQALDSLAVEDLSLGIREEKETGRFEVSGQGELHLDIVAERLRREFGLRIRTGNPRVNCRERLIRGATVKEDFDHDFGGERIRVSVELKVETRREAPVNEVTIAAGLRIQPQLLAATRRGAESAMGVGPLQGWPMEAILVTILALVPPPGGTGRNGEIAVEAASALATRRAMLEAGSEILEPVMRIDIECPEEHFGPVLNAISARGGRIESVEDGAGRKTIVARAPMRMLFGFAGDLRSMSRGRAQFQARFGNYETLRQSPSNPEATLLANKK
ncbi:MAG TPA: GTP-binding protein [Rectinemataceae bacterium]|nr:GTP-binding protein [Rectinemataceae bacterium]